MRQLDPDAAAQQRALVEARDRENAICLSGGGQPALGRGDGCELGLGKFFGTNASLRAHCDCGALRCYAEAGRCELDPLVLAPSAVALVLFAALLWWVGSSLRRTRARARPRVEVEPHPDEPEVRADPSTVGLVSALVVAPFGVFVCTQAFAGGHVLSGYSNLGLWVPGTIVLCAGTFGTLWGAVRTSERSAKTILFVLGALLVPLALGALGLLLAVAV